MIDDNLYISGVKNIELFPTPNQKKLLDSLITGYTIVFNWALNEQINIMISYKNCDSDYNSYSYFDLTMMYLQYRRTNSFLSSLPYTTMKCAIFDVVQGFDMYKKYPTEYHIPYFRDCNKFTSASSFRPASQSDRFYFEDNMLRIEGLPFGEKILTNYHTGSHKADNIKYISPCIYRNNYTGKYYISYGLLQQKLENSLLNIPSSGPIGVDVNKHYIYACSNGIMIESRNLTREIKHLSEIDAELSKYYKNYGDTINFPRNGLFLLEKRRNLYAHISNIHKDICYKGSLDIIRCNPEIIILESLDLTDMKKKKYINKELSHYPLGISQDILEYQAFKYNIPVIRAPKLFQSSNICSNCGAYKDITSHRIFICNECGYREDRDRNAANNLKNWYMLYHGTNAE